MEVPPMEVPPMEVPPMEVPRIDRRIPGIRRSGRGSRPESPRSFLLGVLETLATIAGFVALGVCWAMVESDLRARDEATRPLYAAEMTPEEPSIWLLDGYNVLHVGLLGGRDRAEWWSETRRRELLARAGRFDAEAEIWVVFDGPEDPGAADAASDPDLELGPHCVFAPSADDWLVERVGRAERPDRIAVVTADRRVAGRVQGRGARVVSPRAFLARCDA